MFDVPEPDAAHDRIGLGHAPEREHRDDPEENCRQDGNRRQAAHAHQQRDQGAGHDQFPFRAEHMGMPVQGLVNGEKAPHITAPEKEKTEFTMLAAKAMKEMPNTTDKSSLKPPDRSSLLVMKMTPQSAMATMEIHLPAEPVMVFTTRSRELENSVMPPDAAAISGKQRQSVSRPRTASGFRKERESAVGRRRFAYITVSVVEAVMRRLAGARGPQV